MSSNVKFIVLPIREHTIRRAQRGTYNVMLAINQVIECLCIFAATQNWPQALTATVPKRVGFEFGDKEDADEKADENADADPSEQYEDPS